MATAFQNLDPVAFTLKPQPHIRVAFSASPAVAAVRDKAAEQGASDQTLDEVAAVPPLRVLLAERNAIMERVNTGPEIPEDEQGPIFAEIARLERTISNTPARSAEDAIVKLIASAQVTAEGHELSEEEAIRAIADAQRHFGYGYIHEEMQPAIEAITAAPVAGVSPTLALLLTAAETAEATYNSIYTSTVKPAEERYFALKGGSDQPAIDATHRAYDAANETAGTFLTCTTHAQYAVAGFAASTPADLEAKLTFMVKHQLGDGMDWTTELLADAKRINAGPAGDDVALSKALGDRQALAAEYGATVVLDPTDEAIYLRRLDAIEVAVRDNRAVTISGAVTRLRFAFAGLQPDLWSDHALTDPGSATFRHGLDHADMWEQIVWSTIEDLARMGGVKLAGQVA